eukprot:TRINITY_DN8640_c0_g1_i1.p1 TRINITY_DN8640_c0_g1~~TRINITY_DN8640_c0_g1_i1.p1  ORF type:complete len:234 (-),score=69.87 TRINITY_DN8640_c0_g1_i1:12-713(-)
MHRVLATVSCRRVYTQLSLSSLHRIRYFSTTTVSRQIQNTTQNNNNQEVEEQKDIAEQQHDVVEEGEAEPTEEDQQSDERKPMTLPYTKVFSPKQYQDNIELVSIQELKSMLDSNSKNFVLIDLRRPTEISILTDPPLPRSVVFPMLPVPEAGQQDTFREAYKLTAVKWQETYGFPKLTTSDNIIFYSSSTQRAAQALNSARRLGFRNVKVLEGGARLYNKYYNFLGVTPKND